MGHLELNLLSTQKIVNTNLEVFNIILIFMYRFIPVSY